MTAEQGRGYVDAPLELVDDITDGEIMLLARDAADRCGGVLIGTPYRMHPAEPGHARWEFDMERLVDRLTN